jgi:hypothetical protein
MHLLRSATFWSSLRHRCCVAVQLLAYLVSTLGFPLAATARKDGAQPFPCQDHSCGCQSAEECWRGCCCFSPEERLAWARQHGVEPPAYAERPAPKGWRTPPRREQASRPAPKQACCTGCCQPEQGLEDSSSTKPSCCNTTACQHPAHGNAPTGQPGMSALHCQGLTMLWVSLGTVPFVPSVAWLPQLPTVERLSHLDRSAPSQPHTPPKPPPRSSTA